MFKKPRCSEIKRQTYLLMLGGRPRLKCQARVDGKAPNSSLLLDHCIRLVLYGKTALCFLMRLQTFKKYLLSSFRNKIRYSCYRFIIYIKLNNINSILRNRFPRR